MERLSDGKFKLPQGRISILSGSKVLLLPWVLGRCEPERFRPDFDSSSSA
jgi:hypothetical protein